MKIKIKNKILDVEIADNWWSITKGLSFSFRKRNLLFVMPFEARWSFWMFGMFFPIKIIFLDKDKKVLEMFDAKPLTLNLKTWRTFKPKSPAKYVLETPFNLDIKADDKLNFSI